MGRAVINCERSEAIPPRREPAPAAFELAPRLWRVSIAQRLDGLASLAMTVAHSNSDAL
jgi:hypothetical protein